MKICTICKIPKSLDKFSPRKTAKDGLWGRCKLCHNKEVRESYHKDPKHKLGIDRKSRQKLQNEVNEIKSGAGCAICRENDSICLDFHHLDPSKKHKPVSALVLSKNRDKVLEEIKKCIILCANCHRKLHGKRFILSSDVMAA
jgi:hypothetical protein